MNGRHWLKRATLKLFPCVQNFLLALICSMIAQTCLSQGASTTESPLAALDKPIDFESDKPGSAPLGWGVQPIDVAVVDDRVFHSGQHSVRLEPHNGTPTTLSVLSESISLGLSGKIIELRGFLRTENVSGFAGLWMREEEDGNVVEFDNMQARQLRGTTDWTEYHITLRVHPGAQKLIFGALVNGSGRIWVDDLQLLVDDKPPSHAPKAEHPITAFTQDHQFDRGSGIALSTLTERQIDSLVLLGKVWGFLKYHHPEVTSGQIQWDYELFRVLPAILAAPDRASSQATLLRWINGLRTIKPCEPCAGLSGDIQTRPDLGWISDETLLGKDLAKSLQLIYKNRLPKRQFYVSLVPEIDNPSFDHELSYKSIKFSDAGFQMLALYRFWNIVAYWSPYRMMIGEDWDGVLREFLPRVVLAKSFQEYQLEMMALIAKDRDSHANLWSSLQVRPPTGECRLPIDIRFIGKNAVVDRLLPTNVQTSNQLKVGDVLTSLDGQPVDNLVRDWAPYYAASNEAGRLRDIGLSMTKGPCGPASVQVRQGTETLTVPGTRIPSTNITPYPYAHDLPGDTFRFLSEQVAYLKLSSVTIADIDRYIQLAANTKGIIVDIRNYPPVSVIYALGSHLVSQPTPFALLTTADISNPGAFHRGNIFSLLPTQQYYSGKIIILVDELTQSHAEYTAMALRSTPHAMVIGSTTAGADGNISMVPLPGGLRAAISGNGIFYPDGTPTQQIGIIPDKTVEPTVNDILTGRDAILEEAVRQITGSTIQVEPSVMFPHRSEDSKTTGVH